MAELLAGYSAKAIACNLSQRLFALRERLR